MSFLFVLNSLKLAGSEKKTINIANTLKKRGHEVYICYLNKPHVIYKYINKDIPVFFLDRNKKFDIDVFFKMKNIISTNNIKNVLCVNLYPYIYGFLCKIMSKKIKCFVLINTSDILKFKEKVQMLIYSPLLRASTGMVFGCESQKNQWISRYFLPRIKTSVIYNGVDCSYFSSESIVVGASELRKMYDIPKQDIVIVSVAEFRVEKKQEDLVKAAAALSELGVTVQLVFVGDGPEKRRVEKLSRDLGLGSRVHFPGWVEDVRPFLDMADIFALTSVAVETFSNAVLEAMAMGKPVVLSNIGGASEMVTDGETGFLYRANNIDPLVGKLMCLIENVKIRKEMGKRAKEVVQERFAFDVMVSNYERLVIDP